MSMSALHDRIEGVLLGTAAGDALGAPYEFGPPLPAGTEVAMAGGGPWSPGEWTDDTAMAVAIAEAAARGGDLRADSVQDAVVARWREWSLSAKDVGIQTAAVLSEVASQGAITAVAARRAAAGLHARTGRTAGNGSLMRTAPVALAYLLAGKTGEQGGEQAGEQAGERDMVQAARAISGLTHHDPLAADACVLWCSAIRHAVLSGAIDVRVGLRHLSDDSRDYWQDRIAEAERREPADFPHNGYVVQALQGAWSAIHHTPEPAENPAAGVFRADRMRLALEAAVRGGRDADTVAAIAGGLLGAAYGASAVPLQWRARLHGWPRARARDLVTLASEVARRGIPDGFDGAYRGSETGTAVRHPYDEQVILGGVGALRRLPAGVDAVVSMCRLADRDIRTDMPHVEVRLIDRPGLEDNPHLEFVLTETARAVEWLRGQGRTVLLHCVGAHSRTPTVAALYGSRLRGVSTAEALQDVRNVLPGADPNPAFRTALRRLSFGETGSQPARRC